MFDLVKLRETRQRLLRELAEIDKRETAAGRNYLEHEEYKARIAELEKTNGDIEAAEAIEADRQRRAQMEGQRQPSPGLEGTGAAARVHERAEDKPWTHIGEFFTAVRQASHHAGSIDPRLRAQSPSEDGFLIPRVQVALPPAQPNERVADYVARTAQFRASGLNETVLSQGGFLVQQDVSTELIRRLYDTSLVWPRCRRFPIGSNSNGVKLPYVDETSRATGSRWGGIRAYWADEAAEKTASKPKFGQIELNLKKLVALCYATDELMQDAVALGAFLEQGFTEEMAFAADDAVINGTGVGQPLGILNAACRVDVAKETSQAADTILYANIVKMYARLWARGFSNAVWLINQDVIPQLTQMTIPVKNVAGSENVGGGAAYMPPGGLSGLPYGTLLSRPVVPIEQCATIGDLGDIMLVDLSQYITIAKDLQTASSIHVRFIYDETAYRFVYRIDGQPAWKSALTPYKGSNTVSPFVALAAR